MSGVPWCLRKLNSGDDLANNLFKGRPRNQDKMSAPFEILMFDEEGISYRLPIYVALFAFVELPPPVAGECKRPFIVEIHELSHVTSDRRSMLASFQLAVMLSHLRNWPFGPLPTEMV